MRPSFTNVCTAVEGVLFKSTGGKPDVKVTFTYADGTSYYVKYMYSINQGLWELSYRVHGSVGWHIGDVSVKHLRNSVEFGAIMDSWIQYELSTVSTVLHGEISDAIGLL